MLELLIASFAGHDSERIALELLDAHGSLGAMMLAFAADDAVWGRIDAGVEGHLVSLARAFTRSLRAEAFWQLQISSSEALLAYLSLNMRSQRCEVFRALFLDSGNRLLADKILWTGTVDTVQVHPREVVREALLADASAVIFAHNHPSGDPAPTKADIGTTEDLVRACRAVRLAVTDHVIVGGNTVFSMRREGILQAIEERLFGRDSPGGGNPGEPRAGRDDGGEPLKQGHTS